MSRTAKKKLMIFPDKFKTMLEGRVFNQTCTHFQVVKGKKRVWIDKVEYLKILN